MTFLRYLNNDKGPFSPEFQLAGRVFWLRREPEVPSLQSARKSALFCENLRVNSPSIKSAESALKKAREVVPPRKKAGAEKKSSTPADIKKEPALL